MSAGYRCRPVVHPDRVGSSVVGGRRSRSPRQRRATPQSPPGSLWAFGDGRDRHVEIVQRVDLWPTNRPGARYRQLSVATSRRQGRVSLLAALHLAGGSDRSDRPSPSDVGTGGLRSSSPTAADCTFSPVTPNLVKAPGFLTHGSGAVHPC